MGSDFVDKTKADFKKCWDRGRVDLGTADLFTRQIPLAKRTCAADIVDSAPISVGDVLCVEYLGGELIAQKAGKTVGRITDIRPELLDAIKDSCGLAKATVEQVYDIAEMMDLSLC